MESYSTFCINDYEVFSTKNNVANIVMSLFTENMKQVNSEEIDGDMQLRHIYKVRSKDFAKRLDIMGYTYEVAIINFQKNYDENEYFEYMDEEYRPHKGVMK